MEYGNWRHNRSLRIAVPTFLVNLQLKVTKGGSRRFQYFSSKQHSPLFWNSSWIDIIFAQQGLSKSRQCINALQPTIQSPVKGNDLSAGKPTQLGSVRCPAMGNTLIYFPELDFQFDFQCAADVAYLISIACSEFGGRGRKSCSKFSNLILIPGNGNRRPSFLLFGQPSTTVYLLG